MGTLCCTSTTRDFKTITGRLEHEGLSFLTITLPSFGKSLERALDQGQVSHDLFAGFSQVGGLPRFLGGFLDLVFERGSGRLLDVPSIDAIYAIRQITLMFAKINLPCSDARVAAAIERYIECERETRESSATIDQNLVDRFSRIGGLLFADTFSAVEREVLDGRIIPKHGPGRTADRLDGNDKWNQAEWTDRLERVFPSWEYLVSGRREDDMVALAGLRILEPGSERPVRVITVPKTLSTPRIIAIEPTCMQYMQQGLLASFGRNLRRNHTAWDLIGWGDQMPNQLLAREGSSSGTLATLDLSEASDRVGNEQVRALLRRWPHLWEAIDACRSRKARVLGADLEDLSKFASMGSALTFPIESMVFASIVFLGIEDVLSRRIGPHDIRAHVGRVRIYGDDIVIPVEYVHAVMGRLEDFGLKVNSNKSFWTGKFRESCGGDYYDGEDVAIVRLRSELPTSRRHGSEIVSTVATRNLLYKAGLWKTARYLDIVMERIVPWPRVSETSPVLGRLSFLGPDLSGKLDKMHRPLVKGARISCRIPDSPLGDGGALLKCLTLAELSRDRSTSSLGFRDLDFLGPESMDYLSLPAQDVDHLDRAGRPRSVEIRIGTGPST